MIIWRIEIMECVKFLYPTCPKCGRILKPSVTSGKLEITQYEHKIGKRIELHDILICRYCMIYIKVELLRNKRNPIKFLEQFKKIPENTEIEDKENLLKYNHNVIPKKCPYCGSKNIKKEPDVEGTWECLDCTANFDWKKFIVLYLVEVNIECPSDEVEEWASDLIDDGETQLLGHWEDRKYDAHVRFWINKRDLS